MSDCQRSLSYIAIVAISICFLMALISGLMKTQKCDKVCYGMMFIALGCVGVGQLLNDPGNVNENYNTSSTPGPRPPTPCGTCVENVKKKISPGGCNMLECDKLCKPAEKSDFGLCSYGSESCHSCYYPTKAGKKSEKKRKFPPLRLACAPGPVGPAGPTIKCDTDKSSDCIAGSSAWNCTGDKMYNLPYSSSGCSDDGDCKFPNECSVSGYTPKCVPTTDCDGNISQNYGGQCACCKSSPG
jgi:hypothetical protein